MVLKEWEARYIYFSKQELEDAFNVDLSTLPVRKLPSTHGETTANTIKYTNHEHITDELRIEKAKNAQLQAEIERLKAENAELKAQLQDNAQRQSAVDSEPVLGNAKAYDVRERETHLLIIGALSNLLAENKQNYKKGNCGINQSAISKDIETEIIELLQPATKTRTIDTIRPRIRESLNLITKAE